MVPLHRKLSGPQGRSARVWRTENFLLPPEFEPRIVQHVPRYSCSVRICKIFQSRHFEVCFRRQSSFLFFLSLYLCWLSIIRLWKKMTGFFFFVMRGFSFSQQWCRKLKCYGMRRCVVWCMVLNVTKDRNTFIFKGRVKYFYICFFQ